jgi:SAM-dependent methyltransferase
VSVHGTLGALFHDIDAPRANDVEVDWYARHLPRDAGPVLDVMTGWGRLLRPLLDAGFQVHGVDISEPMLARCARRIAGSGRTAQLFRQNVTALNLPTRYAAAFIASGSFQLLTEPVAALDALLRIRAHLIDPGLLLLDLFVPTVAEHPPGAPIVELRTVVSGDGTRIAMRSETRCHVPVRRIDLSARYERRDKLKVIEREDETSSLTWYDEAEASTLLGDAGYRDIRIEPSAWSRDDGRHFSVSARA